MSVTNTLSISKFDIYLLMKYIYSVHLTDEDIARLKDYIDLFSVEEFEVFKQIAEKFKYETKYMGRKCYTLSRNAILLAWKIYEDTGYKVFPCVIKVATKGWDISGGTYAWYMLRLDEGFPAAQLYSRTRVSDCLRKSYRLGCIKEYDDFVIWTEKKI